MIRIQGLTKRYPTTSRAAVDNLTLEIPTGCFFTLLGPSGCGKSTTLRCIAGLERPDVGEIWIGDTLVSDGRRGMHVPAFRRRLGMVFQSYAIWPHMTVRENVAYPLRNLPKAASMSRDQIDDAVASALRLVSMDHLIDRPSPLLSGGEQQRVALARALVHRPQVLLLDEPLSNLDAKLREQMRIELRDLQRALGLTVVYVTHDQDEAFSLSDQMAVMSQGRIEELGEPTEIYSASATRFGTEFLGQSTQVAGIVAQEDGAGKAIVDTALGQLACRSRDQLRAGDEVWVYVRPEDLSLHPPARSDDPSQRQLEARITRVSFLGGFTDWWAEAGEVVLRGRSLGSLDAPTRASVGQPVLLTIGLTRCLRASHGGGRKDDVGIGGPVAELIEVR
jgi:iron(III) transport system ATP-binding protein